MNYIVLSPVGKTRLKHFDAWLENVLSFTPPPSEIVICIDEDMDFTPPDNVTLLYSPTIDYYHGHLERICSGREVLRRYFLSQEHENALWIDSDITLPPETPTILSEVLHEENVYVVVNKYQGRGDSKWCGSGVMFMQKNACRLSRFWVSYIWTEDGEEKHLSEDFIFFAIFDQGSRLLEQWSGKRGRVCKEYVIATHLSV